MAPAFFVAARFVAARFVAARFVAARFAAVAVAFFVDEAARLVANFVRTDAAFLATELRVTARF